MGGKCSRCEYDKNYAAPDFHHKEPAEKEFDWKKTRLRSWPVVLEELKKCSLLCKNCHAEIHNPNAGLKDCENNILNDNNFLNFKIKPTGNCPICKLEVYGTIYCSVSCSSASRRKVQRPSKEELKK